MAVNKSVIERNISTLAHFSFVYFACQTIYTSLLRVCMKYVLLTAITSAKFLCSERNFRPCNRRSASSSKREINNGIFITNIDSENKQNYKI